MNDLKFKIGDHVVPLRSFDCQGGYGSNKLVVSAPAVGTVVKTISSDFHLPDSFEVSFQVSRGVKFIVVAREDDLRKANPFEIFA